MATKETKAYGAQEIKVLEGLEAVRKRPAMYIGSTSLAGLHHLVYEIVDNSVDEALGGHCDTIDIKLYSDGSCSVQDNGRGIPVDLHPTEKISAAEVVLTKLHAGGKFDKDSYKYSGGLHGVGVSVVNALSQDLFLRIYRDGKVWEQHYKIGKPQARLAATGESSMRGTYVRFKPDETIFEDTNFNFDTLSARLRELAFLNKGLKISIQDERTGAEHSFFFEGGIVSFINHINSKKVPLFPQVIELHKEDDVYMLDFACQYNDGYSEQTYSFVNNIRTVEGGTHESGFKSALTKACNKYGQTIGLIKEENLSSDDVREGLVSVLSVKVPEPQFEGQTKTKLGNTEIKGVVDSWIYTFLSTYFEENPQVARKIIQKGVLAQQARNAAKKARELTRRKTVLEGSILPGKLADCSEEDPTKTEIYIVEGDSAGGTAKQGRDRFTQAILPLRGKIINVEKARLDRMLANNEVKDLITAIGAGVGNEELDVTKARYHKIVIMTDADVDGAHIRILLLTFFFRHMLPLIDHGYVYIAQPPLYKVKVGRTERYLKDDSELNQFLFDWAGGHTELLLNKKPVETTQLTAILNALLKYEAKLIKVSTLVELLPRFCHELVLFLKDTQWKPGALSDQDIFEKLRTHFTHYEVSTIKKEDPESEIELEGDKHPQRASVIFKQDKREWEVPFKFFANPDLETLLDLYNSIDIEEITPWEFKHTGRELSESGQGVYRLAQTIINLGRSLMTIQRYKGLGEMNAEQLWETTMDPAHRTLLKVSIEDALAADQWFSSLMGDAVEDRRQYIEKHAHFVRNLDI